MAKLTKQQLEQREQKRKREELELAIEKLGGNSDFQKYQEMLREMAEAIKERCVRAENIEEVKRLQSQWALLVSIYGFGELPEEARTTNGE